MMDGFKMHIDQATQNSDGSYKGNGYIVWHPFAADIKLAVNFDTLRVNTDKVVFGGSALTSTVSGNTQWSPFGATDPVARLTGMDQNSCQALAARFNGGANMINQSLGGEVAFPLGVNTTLGGAPFTLAIMGISFRPACTNMNVMLDMNLPDMGGWLALAGTGFQVDPNKLLAQDVGGVLYLPQDHALTLSGMKFTFNGCPGAGGNSVDTSKGSYVEWDETNGLREIEVNSDIRFTNSSSIVAVDNTDKRLTDPAGVHARFSFSDWNDWMASVTPLSNLELGSLPGFMIAFTGGYYDHSTKENPGAIVFPAGYAGTTDASWQGLYMPDLTLQLPSSLSGTNSASFGFHNFILDNTGVSTTISADHILDISTGNLGGWAFSIDHIGIGVVQDNFQKGMQMTGGIKIPLSDDALAYTCNLSVGEGTGLSYQFSVTPNGNYNVNMWAATVGLQGGSSLVITNSSGQFIINAKLNGNVTINTDKISSSLPDVSITALSFQGMTITNHDPKTNAFGFDPGNWSFAGKGIPGMAKNERSAGQPGEPGADPGSGMLAGGPQPMANEAMETQAMENQATGKGGFGGSGASADVPDNGAEIDKEAAIYYAGSGGQSGADGFSINITGFKPYVQFPSSSEADIGVTFTLNAVLDESGLGIGGAATMDIFGKINFPKGGTPIINATPNINLDSVGIDCNMDLMHITGGLKFNRNDAVFGNDVKGHLDLSFLGTIEVQAAAIFGHTNGYNYWGLAATTFWPQGIMFPPVFL